MAFTKLKNCLACNSKNLKQVLDLNSQPLANSYLKNRHSKEKKYPMTVSDRLPRRGEGHGPDAVSNSISWGGRSSQKTHRELETIRPLQDGVIADFAMTDGMLQGFIRKINLNRLARPRMVICVPSGVTEVERRAVKDSGERANAREVYLIEEPVAAAIGIGLDISQPIGNIIVDIDKMNYSGDNSYK